MRRFLQWLLRKPLTWMAERFSSAPRQKDVFASLDLLLKDLKAGKISAGPIVPFDSQQHKFIIVSDQHKGARDGADDFARAEKNYLEALQYYFEADFTLVNIGDAEELWENTPAMVIEKNRAVLLEEARFLTANRYYRTFGNHDLEWKYDLPRNLYLKPIFGEKLQVPEGILLQTCIGDRSLELLLTHGHQGDKQSDGNPVSTWIVAALWTPIQRFLSISVNTTANSYGLVDKHNIMMYEWSARQKDLILISGHTHKPVFASLDHIDRISLELNKAIEAKDQEKIEKLQAELVFRKKEYQGKQTNRVMEQPSYFNTGCCCFADGDITAIEISEGMIRLVKWQDEAGESKRILLEESSLEYLSGKIN